MLKSVPIKLTMNKVIHDNNNPKWIGLETLVKNLNEELIELAEFYFDDETVSVLRQDEGLLSTATLNISKACLEVIDSTCVVMATMRSIVKKQSKDLAQDICSTEKKLTENIFCKLGINKKADGEMKQWSDNSDNNLTPILSLLEVAVGEMKNVVNKEVTAKTGNANPNKEKKGIKKADSSKVKHTYRKESNTTRR